MGARRCQDSDERGREGAGERYRGVGLDGMGLDGFWVGGYAFGVLVEKGISWFV